MCGYNITQIFVMDDEHDDARRGDRRGQHVQCVRSAGVAYVLPSSRVSRFSVVQDRLAYGLIHSTGELAKHYLTRRRHEGACPPLIGYLKVCPTGGPRYPYGESGA